MGGVPFVKLEVGKPMYTIFGLQQNGVITQADIDKGGTTIGGKALVLGDPRYIDQNADGKINSGDRVDLGIQHQNTLGVLPMTSNTKISI